MSKKSSNSRNNNSNSNNNNPHVVNVYIHDNNNIPSPKKIAEKYNVDYDPSDDDNDNDNDNDNNNNNNNNNEGRMRSDSLEYDEVQLNNEINEQNQSKNNNKVEDLIIKLDKKNREIEKLCVLLEAVSVVPGADPGKYMEIIDGGKEEIIDYRDSKIVSLAKKCRNLTVALNKERSLSRNSTSIISQLQDENERLKKELHLVSSPAARAAAVRDIKSADVDTNRDLKKELAQQQKLTDEWRKKYQQAQEESKKLTRALTKELGEGVTIEEAVDDGWRGRAQTIVMLKAKIRKLESGASSGTTPQGKRREKREDVDSKAEEELNNMVSERQQAVEFLTEDHARLTEEAEQLKNRVNKYKARVRALESDSATHKQQLKVLVEKTESDDILIEALQEEMQSLRQSNEDMKKKLAQQQQQLSQTTTLRTMRMNENGTGMIPAITTQEGNEHEILRLKRLCKQQAAQIETQETVIQQLRNSLPKTNKR